MATIKQGFKYQIVSAQTTAELEREVDRLADLDWICTGGICYAEGGAVPFYQAMIKYRPFNSE